MEPDSSPGSSHLHPVLERMAARGATRVLKRVVRFLEKPTTGSAHALSTGLTRLLAVDTLSRQVFNLGCVKPRGWGIRPLRKRLGRLRDAQELLDKLKKGRPPRNRTTQGFRVWMEMELMQALLGFQKDLAGFSLQPLQALALGHRYARRLDSRPARPLAGIRQDLFREVARFRGSALDGGDNEALHKMRVRFKVYRYAIDLLPRRLSGADATLRKELKSYQDLLGEAHDWHVMELRFRSFRALRPDLPWRQLDAWIGKRSEAAHSAARAGMRAALTRLEAWEISLQPPDPPPGSADLALPVHPESAVSPHLFLDEDEDDPLESGNLPSSPDPSGVVPAPSHPPPRDHENPPTFTLAG